MSDKEYGVDLDCVSMNFSEETVLPPSFRDSNTGLKEKMCLLADKVNMNGQVLFSRMVTIIAVEIDHALLELWHTRGFPFGTYCYRRFFGSYRMTSLSEADLYVTVPRFYVLDIRPDTKPEMTFMVRSSAHAPKQTTSGSRLSSYSRCGCPDNHVFNGLQVAIIITIICAQSSTALCSCCPPFSSCCWCVLCACIGVTNWETGINGLQK